VNKLTCTAATIKLSFYKTSRQTSSATARHAPQVVWETQTALGLQEGNSFVMSLQGTLKQVQDDDTLYTVQDLLYLKRHLDVDVVDVDFGEFLFILLSRFALSSTLTLLLSS
jgi:hypothetical protein